MLAIYKRELRSYFTGVIGYVFLVIYLAVAAVLFCYTTLFAMSAGVSSFYMLMLIFSAVVLPLLTMKSFSEERKTKTEQLILTAPVSIPRMVMGKFLAAYTVFGAAAILCSLYFLLLIPYAQLQYATLLGNALALLLVGFVFISIGLFVSSLTESQLVAAIVSVVVDLGLLLVDSLASVMPNVTLQKAVMSLSMADRYGNFTMGILDFADTFFFLSVIALFIFLTGRVLEKRRWG